MPAMDNIQKRNMLLEELGAIHDEWRAEMSDKVAFKPETDEPHHPDLGITDYQELYTDANPTFEQEQVYQDRAQPILDQLAALGQDQPEPDVTALMDKVSETEEFELAVNGAIVQMLLKTDLDAGLQSYRHRGEWIAISPDDDLPALDDADLLEVVGDATAIWDEKEGQELLVSDFKEVLLDQA
jgi:hypothetical protein